MKNIKAVLFDLVGTLIYVKDPIGYVYSKVARSFGIETDYQKLENAFQEVFRNEPKPVGGNDAEKQWWWNIVLKTFKSAGYELEEKFEKVFEELFKVFSQRSAWAIYPDVIFAIETCIGRSLKAGIISNFDSRLEIILEELNLNKYFNCLAYSGKVGFSKPDPRIFKYALNELGVIPEETVYIGDSLNIDYYPARDLNINSLLIDRDRTLKDGGIKTISNLNQIFDYL